MRAQQVGDATRRRGRQGKSVFFCCVGERRNEGQSIISPSAFAAHLPSENIEGGKFEPQIDRQRRVGGGERRAKKSGLRGKERQKEMRS